MTRLELVACYRCDQCGVVARVPLRSPVPTWQLWRLARVVAPAGWRVSGLGPVMVVSPTAAPDVELEVTVADVVWLRRRSANVVADRHEARAVLLERRP